MSETLENFLRVINEYTNSIQNLPTEPILVETEKYYCPFLERGFCRDSTRCGFSHDCSASIKIPAEYCHFYLANQCLFGADCKFLHSEPIDDNASLSNIVDTNSNRDGGSPYVDNNIGSGDNNDYQNDNLSSEQADHYDGARCDDERDEVDGHQKRDDEIANSRYVTDYDQQQQSGQNDEESSIYNNNNNDDLGCRPNPVDIDEQPSSSSSCLRAIRISRRCAMTTPSSSKTTVAKLKLPANLSSQTQSKTSSTNCPTSENKTQTTTTPTTATTTAASKSVWQGARLIASIRSNLGISNQSAASSSEDAKSSSNDPDQHLKDLPMCPYSVASGECPYAEGDCQYLHGLICDLCYSACLHPYDEKQRHQHREECLREHEREMELSFAVQRSKDKVCGICMDTVVEKKPVTSSRFGILEKCNHTFCLDCIRKWRGTKQFDSRTIRACPECRVSSAFVIPSKYWIEDQDEKDRLINEYKSALKSKPCRYFNEGKGDCPFAGSCFYKHAYPDGRLAVMDAPKPRRRLYGARGPTSVANYILWNILTSTDEDEISENEIDLFTDEDDTDRHDYNDSDLESQFWDF